MTRHLRPGIAAVLALSLAAGLPLSAAAAAATAAGEPPPQLHIEVLRLASASGAAGGAHAAGGGAHAAGGGAHAALRASASSPNPCADKAYRLEGGRWNRTYEWSFRIGSTPAGLNRAAVERAIKKGVANIVKANNDCGRADRVSAKAAYRGTTTRKPSCAISDGYNVVGFRKLSSGTAARACWWVSGNRIVEADVQLNSSLPWATSLAGCRNQLMVEAVMTHEAGHVFGLGHVGEGKHGRLTMSTYIDGECQNNESTLGLGDMRGLEKLYP